MVDWLSDYLPASALTLLELGLLVLALIIAPRGRRPSSGLAWILLIVALPLLGLLLFAIIGSPQLPKARRDKQRTMDERIEERTRSVEHVTRERCSPPWLSAVARLNRETGALPLVDGNRAHLLPHFDDQLTALVAAIDRAQRTVHVEFYILALDDTTRPFYAALERAVSRGVDVRVLVDHLGSLKYPGFKPGLKELTRIGVEWHLMLPVQPLKGRYQRPDLRNHRKLVVVDTTIAFVGSLNMIDPGYQTRANRRRHLRWRDLMAEVHGPVVQEVQAIFITDWFSETDRLPAATAVDAVADDDDPTTLLAQLVPSGPAFESENNLALFNSLLYAAEQRVVITSPYFVPDESLLAAILTAVRRGVEVELYVSEIGDQFFVHHAQHSYYEALLSGGVQIFQYAAPTILHSKHVSIDEEVALVGSSNMDIRSFQLDLEVMMLVSGRSFVQQMRAVEREYREHSTELTLDTWRRRGLWHEFVDNFARLTSAVQ